MRPVRSVGWAVMAAAFVSVGACNPAVAPPALPAPAPVAPPAAELSTTPPPASSIRPPEPPPTTPVASVPTPTPAAVDPSEPAHPIPAPADPAREQVRALERQVADLKAQLDAAKASIPPAPPAPEPAPAPADPNKKPEFPTLIEGKNLDEWLELTKSHDPAIRQSAAETVTRFGPDARKPALNYLVPLLNDKDPGVRMSSLSTVGAMLFEAKDEQTKVFTALRLLLANASPGGPSRKYATNALAAYGADAGTPANIAALDQLKNDPWWETRQAVASALGKIGAAVYDDPPKKDAATGHLIPKKLASEPAQKILRHLLETDTSAAVRLEAVYALLAHGPPPYTNPADYAKAVGPNLEAVTVRLTGKSADGKKVAAETDHSVQVWLHLLHVMYDDQSFKTTLPKIGDFLQDPSIVVRGQALAVLAQFGPRAEPLLPQVRECLTGYKDYPILLAGAVNVLAAMGKKVAEGTIPDLEKVRDETKDPELKRMAREAIDILSGKKKVDEPKDAAKP